MKTAQSAGYSPLKHAGIRALRVFLAVLVSGSVVQLTGDAEWMFLVPVLNGLGKWLRDQYNVPYMPV